MSGDKSVFGYGSLILPPSLVARFEEVDVPEVDPIYEQGRTYGDPELTRDEADEAWSDLLGDINAIPVRVEGLKRMYTHDSPRGGAMLDAVESDDDFVNGIIYTGLTEDQLEDVAGTETNYERVEIDKGRIEPYISDELMADMGVELPETVEVFSPTEEPETVRLPNETYHDRIKAGILDYMEDQYGEEVSREFWNDFITTTEGYNALNGRMENADNVVGGMKAARFLWE